jgi:DNA-directed RNA polymerase subunit K/omega
MPDQPGDTDSKRLDQPHLKMDVLMKKIGKYALVSVVAKRAADIKARQARVAGADAADNAVTLAMSDVAQGRVKVVREKQ